MLQTYQALLSAWVTHDPTSPPYVLRCPPGSNQMRDILEPSSVPLGYLSGPDDHRDSRCYLGRIHCVNAIGGPWTCETVQPSGGDPIRGPFRGACLVLLSCMNKFKWWYFSAWHLNQYNFRTVQSGKHWLENKVPTRLCIGAWDTRLCRTGSVLSPSFSTTPPQ